MKNCLGIKIVWNLFIFVLNFKLNHKKLLSKTGDIFINAKVHILIDLLFFEITGMQHFETGVTNTLCGRTIQFLLFLF